MKLTERDIALIRDMALSHVLSRDQIVDLGYFSSITRVNTRLRDLVKQNLVRILDLPFFAQRLYVTGVRAKEVVGERIARLIANRTPSPRFLQHALAVTNVRLALTRRKPGRWRFEQQLWRKLKGSSSPEIRPDGLFESDIPIFVEVDMGHVAPGKFKEKLRGYQSLADSEECERLYGFSTFRLLTVTTGPLRSRRLGRLAPSQPSFDYRVQTFEEVGAAPVSSWS